MRFNFNKYFEEAEKRGIAPYSIGFGRTTETSVEVFNGEVETQQIGSTQEIGARGLHDGKIGGFSTDAIDAKTPEIMAEKVLEASKFGKEDKAENFFAGGLRYRKIEGEDIEMKKSTLKELREAAIAFSKKIQGLDKRVTQVTVGLSMVESEMMKRNSLGLKFSQKSSYYVGSVELVCEDESKEPRSSSIGFYSFLSLEDLMKEGEKKLSDLLHGVIDFFKTGPCASKKYKAVLSPSCVADLFSFLKGHFNAKSVEKHLSVFEGKVGEEIMSKKLTILHTPHKNTPAAMKCDSDGYPAQDFTLIKRGVLQTYCYSLETANQENRKSNGCACGGGNAVPGCLTVKEGKKTKEELFEEMGNGIYINNISGLNSGINSQTLDFSLPCQGYLIKDGKKDKAVSMIVCAGNLQDLFEHVVDLANDSRFTSGMITPSILFKSLAISGQ